MMARDCAQRRPADAIGSIAGRRLTQGLFVPDGMAKGECPTHSLSLDGIINRADGERSCR